MTLNGYVISRKAVMNRKDYKCKSCGIEVNKGETMVTITKMMGGWYDNRRFCFSCSMKYNEERLMK